MTIISTRITINSIKFANYVSLLCTNTRHYALLVEAVVIKMPYAVASCGASAAMKGK